MNSVNVFIPSVKKDKIVNDKEIGKRFKKKRLLENITFQVNKECLSFLTLELVETLSAAILKQKVAFLTSVHNKVVEVIVVIIVKQ